MDLLFGLSLCLNILLGYRFYQERKERKQLETSLRAFRSWNEKFMEGVQADQRDFIKTYLEYQKRSSKDLHEWLQDVIDNLDDDQ